jgi:hypothetical protein
MLILISNINCCEIRKCNHTFGWNFTFFKIEKEECIYKKYGKQYLTFLLDNHMHKLLRVKQDK